MATLLAKNADVVVTMDGQRRELKNAGLFARDGVIEQVGFTAELPGTADRCSTSAVTFCSRIDQLSPPPRSGADAESTRRPEHEPLPLAEGALRDLGARTPEDTRTAVIVGCAELARSGCTTVFDHAYVFKNGCKVDDQIHAAAEIGVRFVVSRGSMSLGQSKGGLPPDNCVEDEKEILSDSVRVIEQYHNPKPGSMLQIVLAPCSPFSVTANLMRESAKIASSTASAAHASL